MDNFKTNIDAYNKRAQKEKGIFDYRSIFYGKDIVDTILNDYMWWKKSDWYNVDVWWWMWNKTLKIYKKLISEKWTLELLEPSEWMREQAKKILEGTNVIIKEWDTSDLSEYKNIDNYFSNQMTHHLTDNEKQEFFDNMYKTLKKWWKAFILDTLEPNKNIPKILFDFIYSKYTKGKWNYYNITEQEYIDMLIKSWFDVEIENFCSFNIINILIKLGLSWYFITLIIVTKK